MKLVITLRKIEDGEYTIEVNPPVGGAYRRTFTEEGLNEYLATNKKYCEHNGYEFTYRDATQEIKVGHGGKREGSGRTQIGTTKKVSMTLSDEVWEMLEDRKKEWGTNQSETLRLILEGYLYGADDD